MTCLLSIPLELLHLLAVRTIRVVLMHLDETFDVHVNNRCLFLCAAPVLVSAYRVSIELCVGWLCVSLGWRDNSQLLKHREYFGGRGIARCPPLHNFSEHICDVAVYFGGGSIAHRPSSSHRRHVLRREGNSRPHMSAGFSTGAQMAGSSTFTALSPTKRRGMFRCEVVDRMFAVSLALLT